MSELSPLTELLLAHARSRTPAEAAELILAEVGGGSSPADVVRRLAGAVQKEIGQCWQRNVLTTADEHLAAEVVSEVLSILARVPVTVADPPRGRIVVVCAEGDHHTLPARMAGLLLGWDGWSVTPLGGSLPADDFRTWLSDARPDAVAISCAVPLFLPGVLTMADAARAVGVPTVVGGGGLGVDRRRAAALGLRWAGTPEAVAAVLAGPEPPVDPDALERRRQDFHSLEAMVPSTVEAACIRLSLDVPEVREYSRQEWQRTRRDLTAVMRILAVTVLCDDPVLLSDFLSWLQVLRTSRGVPEVLLPASVDAVAAVVPRQHADLVKQLRRGLEEARIAS